MRDLARRAYAIYVERIGKEPAPMTFDYAAIAASGDALLAWSDDQLVGMLITRLEDPALHIHNLAVSPDVQGLGLGSALLIEAEQLARRAGRDELRLYTNEAMLENLTFYRRRGYQETHRDIEDGFRRVYFIKRLEPAHVSFHDRRASDCPEQELMTNHRGSAKVSAGTREMTSNSVGTAAMVQLLPLVLPIRRPIAEPTRGSAWQALLPNLVLERSVQFGHTPT
ncbi:GNAT family N-acetyltransferase [Arthrobacter sp. TES]|nr:GNAT family N-acetyltransferase [Paenarthrobacter ureafaciens]QOI65059.1 GNAT family N-acetyltransferase [Arthrobacter sp. TES]RWW94801.1 N-acetyltransferase [Paenarthrobacter ureafaciens]GLU58496.1 hypothetical protein Pure01_10090 [Paenarthrobacter ureafaciens]GLU62795.1 hypothetical protein Pure02_10450 [Paenarthrobacter ureafaciens]GLU67069.1 hypothetical protein Pure03_10450 [Paenarthrobacter ureafaciens]